MWVHYSALAEDLLRNVVLTLVDMQCKLQLRVQELSGTLEKLHESEVLCEMTKPNLIRNWKHSPASLTLDFTHRICHKIMWMDYTGQCFRFGVLELSASAFNWHKKYNKSNEFNEASKVWNNRVRMCWSVTQFYLWLFAKERSALPLSCCNWFNLDLDCQKSPYIVQQIFTSVRLAEGLVINNF